MTTKMAGKVVLRIHCAVSSPPPAGSFDHARTRRWWRTASALTGFCLPSCGKPTTKSSPFLAAVSKVPVVVMTFASFVFMSAALGPGIFPSGSDDGRIQVSCEIVVDETGRGVFVHPTFFSFFVFPLSRCDACRGFLGASGCDKIRQHGTC